MYQIFFGSVLILGLIINAPLVSAANFTVTTTNDSGPSSLRQLVANAAAGDNIDFSISGTLTLTNGELLINKNLTIAGPGASNLLVNGNRQGRVFNIVTNVTVSISGITITNGLSSNGTSDGYPGGGLLNSGILTLTDCAIIGNSSGLGGPGTFGGLGGAGGGIYSAGTLTLLRCIVSGNAAGIGGSGGRGSGNWGGGAGGLGGGIYNSGMLISSNSVVTGNRSGAGGAGVGSNYGGIGGYGGGIYNGGILTLTACTLSGNLAGSAGTSPHNGTGSEGGAGGGLANAGTLRMIACAVNDNCAGSGGTCASYSQSGFMGPAGAGGPGGGVGNFFGSMDFINCTLNNNRGGTGANGGVEDHQGQVGGRGGWGGAIASTASFNLLNCTISSNIGGVGGVGGTGRFPPFGKSADGINGNGGGICVSGTIVAQFLNTIIAGNTTGTNAAGPDVNGLFTSLGHNLVGITNSSTGFGISSDRVGNFSVPLDPKLGPLADNGGPTPTCALLLGSPALDAGDDAVLQSTYSATTDQRGQARLSGAHVDIGAYEEIFIDDGSIPASWRLQYFGSTNVDARSCPACDASGTGQDNFFKYTAGLNPTNPASIFTFGIKAISGHPEQKACVFSPYIPDRSYTVLFATNATAAGAWSNLIDTTIIDAEDQRTIVDLDATNPIKFYRLQISYP